MLLSTIHVDISDAVVLEADRVSEEPVKKDSHTLVGNSNVAESILLLDGVDIELKDCVRRLVTALRCRRPRRDYRDPGVRCWYRPCAWGSTR